MAKFFNPHGSEVTAADALIGGKLRPGFKEMLSPGERVSFDMMLMDAKPKGSETSIDVELRKMIASMAKSHGKTPEEYLASTPLAEIQKMAAQAAEKVLESMAGNGIASKLADVRTTPAERERIAFDVSVANLNNAHQKRNCSFTANRCSDATDPALLKQNEDAAHKRASEALNNWRKA